MNPFYEFLHSPQFRLWLFGLALVVSVFFAYQQVWHAGFIWDDDEHLTNTATLHDLHGLKRIWFEVGAVPQYYPMVHTTFWLESRLWGLNPLGYHLVNVLLHALGAVLLWRVLERLKIPGAWLAAAIFALHPVHVESVAWISERKNVLSGALYFAAALAYLRFALKEEFGGHNNETFNIQHSTFNARVWYFIALGLFVCALLSKTVTCSLPAALLLVLWWKRGRLQWSDIRPTLPFFAAGIALGLLTVWIEKHHVKAQGVEWSLSLLDRCLIAGRALWFYAGKLLWPTELTFIYPRWEIDAGAWRQWIFPVLACGTVVTLWLMRQRLGRGPLVAVLIFAGTLFPALGFIDVYPFRYSFVADHFQYLASVGLIVLFAAGAVGFATRLQMKPATNRGLGLALLIVLSAMTWQQSRIYHNLETLWRDTLTKNPNSWMAQNNLGLVLADKGQADAAAIHYQRALEINPRAETAAYNLANLLLANGRVDEAIGYYRKALEIHPEGAAIAYNLGNALSRKGQIDEAIVHYRKALSIQTNAPAIASSLGNALLGRGQADEAITSFQSAVEAAPTSARYRVHLANALVRTGRLSEAISQYDAALQLDPDDVPTLSNLAWVLATCPEPTLRNGTRAVELAGRAAQLSGGSSPTVLRTLSAAYAEAGHFPEAIATVEKALALLSGSGNDAFAGLLRKQLEQFNERLPVRDASLTNSSLGQP